MVTDMRVAILWSVLVIATIANLAMFATLWRGRSAASRRALSNGATELAWAIVPWLIAALCAAPTVHHILANDQRVSESGDAAVLAQAASVPAAPTLRSAMENANVAPVPIGRNSKIRPD